MAETQQVQSLIDIYTKAQQNLIKIITEKEAKGSVTWYQRSILDQVTNELQKLNDAAKSWCETVIPQTYQDGVVSLNKALSEMTGITTLNASFSSLHVDAVETISANTYGQLQDANIYVGRNIYDVVRQSGVDAVAQKLSQGESVKWCKQNIINALINEGINGIKDKRGRNISLDAYASLVARSTTRETTNRATMNQLTGLGYDLVKMSSHSPTCGICATLQGRVYSISGNDKRYPHISMAHKGPYANIHPNCRHVLMPYIERLADDAEGDRAFSNKPFDMDPRSEKEINSYNADQKKKQQLRNDKNQWERYKLALPNDAPKSFSGFQSMKRSNSAKWQQLQEDYKKVVNLEV